MMVDVQLSTKVQDELRELGVSIVYLFGSHADGVAGEDSDVDLGIVMVDPAVVSYHTSTHTLYQKLYEVFSSVDEFSGKNLDIVFLQRASLELRAHAIRAMTILFTQDLSTRLDFEEYTIREYADFAPLRTMIDDAILQRI